VVIATTTDYDQVTNYLNIGSVDAFIRDVNSVNRDALMVIKSTIPVGYAQKLMDSTRCKKFIFSPEFLRDGKALHYSLYQSRIVVGEGSDRAK